MGGLVQETAMKTMCTMETKTVTETETVAVETTMCQHWAVGKRGCVKKWSRVNQGCGVHGMVYHWGVYNRVVHGLHWDQTSVRVVVSDCRRGENGGHR